MCNIGIRRIQENDIETYTSIYRDSKNLKYEYYGELSDTEIYSKFLKAISSEETYGIVDVPKDMLLGIIELRYFEKEDEWHLGVVVDRNKQNQGIANQGVEVFLNEIFKVKYADTIYACCSSDNERAIASLRKNKFTKVNAGKGEFLYYDNKQIVISDLLKYARNIMA